MNYLTRHLEAKRDLPHGDRHIRAGDKFHASQTDADYYVARGMAVEVPEPPAPPTVSKQQPQRPAAPVRAAQKPPEPPPQTAKPASAPATHTDQVISRDAGGRLVVQRDRTVPVTAQPEPGFTRLADLNPAAAAAVVGAPTKVDGKP